MNRRARPVERAIAAGLTVSALGAVSFAVAYLVTDDQLPQGVALAVAFGALAFSLAAWARHLLPQGPLVEEREVGGSAEATRAVLRSRLDRDAPFRRAPLPRRMLAAAVAVLGASLLLPVRSLFTGSRPREHLANTPWRRDTVVVDEDGRPITVDDLVFGTVVTAFPEGATDAPDAAALLIRIEPDELELPGGRRDWAVDGLVAYSKLCTHAGCPVGVYVETTRRLFCPCHQSLFDARRGAVPVAGPAARPLPQLPLDVRDDGVLVARGGFSEPVGPGYWRRT